MNKGLADLGRAFRSTLISGVAYTCALQQPRGIQEGIDKGSARVTVTVSYDRIIFTVNQVMSLGFVLRNFAKETFRKGGDNLFRWQLQVP